MDPLFLPLEIGPKTSKNRLWRMPISGAEVPDGEWGAVFLGETFIVPGARLALPTLNLYDDQHEIAEKNAQIHANGVLAGIEIGYNPPWGVGGRATEILGCYRRAAALIGMVGFDLVTLYMAHGGGAWLQERNLASAVIKVILETVPGVAIGIRTDSFQAVGDLDSLVDYWDIVSPGIYPEVFDPSPVGAKQFTDKPVIHAGFTTPQDMREALNKDHCDIVGLARAALAEPTLPTRLHAGEEVRECTRCQGCVHLYEAGEQVVCTERE